MNKEILNFNPPELDKEWIKSQEQWMKAEAAARAAQAAADAAKAAANSLKPSGPMPKRLAEMYNLATLKAEPIPLARIEDTSKPLVNVTKRSQQSMVQLEATPAISAKNATVTNLTISKAQT